MKSIVLFLLLLPMYASAQFVTPVASPPASSTTEAGYTHLTIDYHRPNVRGRVIFGELLPWGEIWRAGANENTLITFDGQVIIDSTEVSAGKYSLYLKPSKNKEWTWVLNRDSSNRGEDDYNMNRDVVRQKAKATRLPERIESLEYRWMNVTPQSVDLVLEWEWYRVALNIELATDKQVDDRAAKYLNPAKSPEEYYAAARYYLDNGMNLEKSKAFLDRWAASGKESYSRTRNQAIVEHRLGNDAKATRLLNRSLQLAREAGNEHFVRLNEQSRKDWTRELTELSADSVLTRSIRYHDPKSVWGTRSHLLQLAESRPNGNVRHTRLTLYPNGQDFDMQQIRGKDKIQLRYLNNSYSFSHQGGTEIDEETREELNLTEERTTWMRDYYTFLYGLPMKLRDPGTRLQPDVHKVWYDGREMLEMEVRYAPETGNDTWLFYFHPETYALSGYAFYHDEKGPGTGEYVLLEGEAEVGPLLLPAKRHWYETSQRLYLGTDEILR